MLLWSTPISFPNFVCVNPLSSLKSFNLFEKFIFITSSFKSFLKFYHTKKLTIDIY